ncbi:hypothetical protein ES695_21160 [Candidatus Atribacteria bacterium 1244-E10-H5-B2]|nr:MAG: hypothetical protein ES695_21160 [Candidatus Atribacteria bacterium 1244-E10-H5-B2]
MKGITKIQLLEDAKKYYGIDISNNILQNYLKIGLIRRLDFDHVKGIRGSVSYFPLNTPGIFYLIEVLQKQEMKLKTIKKYADLLEFNNIEIIQNMIEKQNRALAEIDHRLDIGQNQKQILDKESFDRILSFKLLQRSLLRNEFFEFNRFIELRAYAELDYKEVTEAIIKYVNSTAFDITKLNDTLDFPDIKINLKSTVIPITVKYSEPINRLICFSNKGVKVY